MTVTEVDTLYTMKCYGAGKEPDVAFNTTDALVRLNGIRDFPIVTSDAL